MAEPLVFLPDMMCDARLFGPQIAEFSSEHVVISAPLTMGERIEEMASALLPLLPSKFALAGIGLGGIVAMEMMRRAQDRITRIALIGTTPLGETPQRAADRDPQIALAKAGALEKVLQREFPPEILAPTPHRREVFNLVQAMGQTLGSDVFVAQSRALQRRRDQQGTLRKCRVPALVMCGEHDPMFPLKRHSFMAELIPHARLTVVAGTGHLPVLEDPDTTSNALREWLAQPFVLQ